jgi:hypothetical protein
MALGDRRKFKRGIIMRALITEATGGVGGGRDRRPRIVY